MYCAHALELPIGHWIAQLANSGGRELPEGVSTAIQARGWSSPRWSASK
ncbi:MAG: hypothetical protein ACJ0RQ_13180 [Candidatus Azotimanducaceae bacterium]